jgi:hypothetical protein
MVQLRKMKSSFVLLFLSLSVDSIFAQSNQNSATVPFHLDHNRIIVDVTVPLPNGTSRHIRAWVDNGDPSLNITEDLAGAVAKPWSIYLGNMVIDLSKIPIGEVLPDMRGLGVEMNIPSSVLQNYDVIVDYPKRELTLAARGTGMFRGKKVTAIINKGNGLIQIAGSIDGHPHNLALDMGTPVSFITGDLLSGWQRTHPSWMHMVGAISIANLWGLDGEPACELLRIPKINYGGLILPGLIAVSFEKDRFDYFEKRAGIPTIGLIGADALLNYRVGIDYDHSSVYFQKISDHAPTNLDVVGLILRPEAKGRFAVLGVANLGGSSSVPGVKPGDILLDINNNPVTGLTMGKVWSMLSGDPGSARILTISREGRQFIIKSKVYRFL